MKPTWEDAREWLGAEPYALVELHPDAECLEFGGVRIEPNRTTIRFLNAHLEVQRAYAVGWDRETRIVVWKKLRTETE